MCVQLASTHFQIARAMAAVVVISGWPALPWGHTGCGPVPAMLDALDGHVDSAVLQDLVDAVFGLDSASPPMLRRPSFSTGDAATSSMSSNATQCSPLTAGTAASLINPVPRDVSVLNLTQCGTLRKAVECGLASQIM